MSEVSQQNDKECLSQESYQETPYEDSSWAVIGDPPAPIEFVPMEISVLPKDRNFIDPMFADYGGIIEGVGESRWHLPELEAGQAPKTQVSMQQAISQPETREEILAGLGISEAEIEARVQAAYEEGRQAGFVEAVEEGNQRLGQAEENIKLVLQDLQSQIRDMVDEIERNALQLSVDIAKKLVDTAVEIDPEYIVRLVKEALSQTDPEKVYMIRVGEEDFKFVNFIGLQKRIRSAECQWEFIQDDSIKTGCILETESGVLDFQIEPAWERIKEKVMRLIP